MPICPLNTTLTGSWYLPPQHLWRSFSCGRSIDERNDCRNVEDRLLRKQWNFTDAQWRFRPNNCRLLGYSSAVELGAILANRTILFLGDSLSFNHLSDALCEFQNVLGVQPDYQTSLSQEGTTEWDMRLQVPPFTFSPRSNRTLQHTVATRAFLRWNNNNTWTALAGVRAAQWKSPSVPYLLPIIFERFNITHRDVVVLNKGQHGWVEMGPEIVLMMEAVQNYSTHADSPLFLWRETFPQHVASESGDYSKAKLKFKCVPVEVDNSIRNTITNPVVDRYGLYNLRVFRPTLERWHEHHGQYDDSDYDCTHFCVPSSVMRFATDLLLHHIILLRP